MSRRNRKKVTHHKRTITRRWIVNNLGVLTLVLMVVVSCLIFALQNYYYNASKQYLDSKARSVKEILAQYSENPTVNFAAEVRNMVESFSDKDKMELMIINSKGNVVLTSSGFSPKAHALMPDYEKLRENLKDNGYFTGKSENGEKIMAVSYPVSSVNSDYHAIRVVVSMEKIDKTVAKIVFLICAGCLMILGMLIFSGMYFVRSIVKPIQQIGEATAKFAKGDFKERIPTEGDDEISDLCGAINYMADELSNSEAMKNEFISSVSHELRTPLTAIKGWAETLNIDNDPETHQKGLRVIINETERLSQMVEELLDFSRIQNGRFTLQMCTMDILAELEDAILIYAERAKQEKIYMVYDFPEMLPFVYGDKNRIRQVFINVIDNAIKYSNPNGIVTIEAVMPEGRDVIEFYIADTGCGISAADLPRIKTKFFKANHTKRGSGIGLAVANEIITMHNGSIDIHSVEGEGTTVVITLPYIKPEKNEKNAGN